MTDINYALVAYEVTIAPRYKPAEVLPLDNFDGNGSQFLRFLASYVKSMPADRLIRDGSRRYGEPEEIVMSGATYSCRVISGNSGIISRFRNRDRTSAFHRSNEDVEEMNYGVYAMQPPAAKVGFLLVERIAGRTISRAFRTAMLNQFKVIHPEYILTLSRTAETDAWKAAEEAAESVAVSKITAIHRGIEASAMSELGIGGASRPLGEYHQVLKFRDEPESGSLLTKARNFFFPPDSRVVAEGGTVSMGVGDDGGENENEDDVNELIAEVSVAGQPKKSIRCSGARPPLINYPIAVGKQEAPPAAFLRVAKSTAVKLAESTDCRLDRGWDTGLWEDADALPTWEVSGFAADTDPAEEPSE